MGFWSTLPMSMMFRVTWELVFVERANVSFTFGLKTSLLKTSMRATLIASVRFGIGGAMVRARQ